MYPRLEEFKCSLASKRRDPRVTDVPSIPSVLPSYVLSVKLNLKSICTLLRRPYSYGGYNGPVGRKIDLWGTPSGMKRTSVKTLTTSNRSTMFLCPWFKIAELGVT